jgi:2-polyprenyl-3-methyl-5-hydroxy-6-metoxy-1,4-benzoquinol methylase
VQTETYHLNDDGIYVPPVPVKHHNEAFDPAAFELLYQMQKDHFWYVGRRNFIQRAVTRFVPRLRALRRRPLCAIDMGGGCGGWAAYLANQNPGLFSEVATSDTSLDALRLAGSCVPSSIARYQIDLFSIQAERRWDVVFLLDVLEHIEDDAQALEHVARAVVPGGLVIVTMPALQFFHSYNDVLAQHHRRYSKRMVQDLGSAAGLELLDVRYFNFLLSPLVLLSRWRQPAIDFNDHAKVRKLIESTHQTPPKLLNRFLTWLFNLETPWGHRVGFPWGTSVLGVFQVPVR